MSISHKLDTKIMAEEIYILVGIKLWAKAVDVDNRRTDYDGRIVPIAVEKTTSRTGRRRLVGYQMVMTHVKVARHYH